MANALAMVTGKPILGVPVRAPLNVLLWNGEDPLEEVWRRFEATRFYYGVAPEDIGDRIFLESGRNSPIKIARVINGGECQILEPVTSALEAFFLNAGIDVAIFDPFVSSHYIPENDNSKIDATVKEWGRLSDVANCAVELVHHLRKGGGHERTIEDARGAASLIDGLRSARVLAKMTAAEAPSYGVYEDEAWRHFRIADGKLNMARPSSKSRWFRLDSLNLGNATADRPSDEMGIATVFKPPPVFGDIPPLKVNEMFRAIKRNEHAERSRKAPSAKEWFGHWVGEFFEIDTNDKVGRAKVNEMIGSWLKTGALIVENRNDATTNYTDRPYIVYGNWTELKIHQSPPVSTSEE